MRAIVHFTQDSGFETREFTDVTDIQVENESYILFRGEDESTVYIPFRHVGFIEEAPDN